MSQVRFATLEIDHIIDMKSKSDSQIDASNCPLCGELNQCTMAADPKAKECWCNEEKFPRELLAEVPAKAVRRACICANCLERFRSEKEFTDRS